MRNQDSSSSDSYGDALQRAQAVIDARKTSKQTYGDPGRLEAALDGADQRRKKATDTLSSMEGSPQVAPAKEMSSGGQTGDFALAMNEYPRFGEDFARHIQYFNQTFEGVPAPAGPSRQRHSAA